MKTFFTATIAAIANATHQYDVSSYESSFYSDHAQDPVYSRAIEYGPPADPYVDTHGHQHAPVYREPEPVYAEPEPVYHHEPRAHREYHEPAQVYERQAYPVHDPYTD